MVNEARVTWLYALGVGPTHQPRRRGPWSPLVHMAQSFLSPGWTSAHDLSAFHLPVGLGGGKTFTLVKWGV